MRRELFFKRFIIIILAAAVVMFGGLNAVAQDDNGGDNGGDNGDDGDTAGMAGVAVDANGVLSKQYARDPAGCWPKNG